MKATISHIAAEPGRAPYIQLLIEFEHDPSLDEEEEFFQVSFRCYPVRVFVAVDDQRDNPFSGADLEDCILIPVMIIQRILKQDFSPWDSFLSCMVYGGYVTPSNTEDGPMRFEDEMETIKKYYSRIEPKIKEWMDTCGMKYDLGAKLPDHPYNDIRS